jgi:hypothetical protein
MKSEGSLSCEISGSHGGDYEDVFWVVAPCSLVEFTDVSEVLAASIIRAIMMEAVSTSQTSVNFYQTTRRNNPEDSHLRSLSCSQEPALHVAVCFFLRW